MKATCTQGQRARARSHDQQDEHLPILTCQCKGLPVTSAAVNKVSRPRTCQQWQAEIPMPVTTANNVGACTHWQMLFAVTTIQQCCERMAVIR